jgi:hypothetical protein
LYDFGQKLAKKNLPIGDSVIPCYDKQAGALRPVTVQAKAGKISDGLEDHTVTRLLLKAPPSGGASRGRFAPSNTRIFQEFNIFLKNACERLRIMSLSFLSRGGAGLAM